MFVEILATLMASQAVPDVAAHPTMSAAVPLKSISIPDEIALQAIPYLDCRQAESGVQRRDASGNFYTPEPPPEGCATIREKAHKDMVARLASLGKGRTRKDREAYAERVLSQIDEFARPIDIEALNQQLREEQDAMAESVTE